MNRLPSPEGSQAPDSTIDVSYDRQRSRQAEMLLGRFTEADVLAGPLVSDCAAGSAVRSRRTSDRIS